MSAMLRPLPWFMIFAAALLGPLPVFAVPLALHYGANNVDINGDGVPDLIMKTRWENYNAHSFDHYMIGIRLKKDETYDRDFYEVPLGDNYNYDFRSAESADCANKDIVAHVAYKFELDKKGWLQVTKYERMGWDDHTEDYPVKVTIYHLTDTVKEYDVTPVGLAPFYLKAVKTSMAKKKYCDVWDLAK
jgi:hypothetical protein